MNAAEAKALLDAASPGEWGYGTDPPVGSIVSDAGALHGGHNICQLHDGGNNWDQIVGNGKLIIASKELARTVIELEAEVERQSEAAILWHGEMETAVAKVTEVMAERDAAQAEVERLGGAKERAIGVAEAYQERVDALQARIDRAMGITIEQLSRLLFGHLMWTDDTPSDEFDCCATEIRALYHEALKGES
jgi:hypothetical protein